MSKKKSKNKPCLFLLDNMGVGGSERKTVVAANYLAQQGYPVYMCFLNVSFDISSTFHPDISYASVNRKGKLDFRAIFDIKKYCKKNKIEIIWAVNLYPVLYMYLSQLTLRKCTVKLIGTTNITHFRNSFERMKMLLYSPIIRRLDTFVYGSYRQRDEWIENYKLNLFERDTVIHNGVDIDKFNRKNINYLKSEIRDKFDFSINEIVIGMVAQFRIEKSHATLLLAVKQLLKKGFPVKVILVGTGNEKKSIYDLCKNEGILQHVLFAGQLDDVRPALLAMDIFALTSKSVETFSNAALEAMSMNLPVVISDLSGAREMIFDKKNGFVFPPGDVDKLTNSLEKLMNIDVRIKFGNFSRKLIEDKFSYERMGNKYIDVIWDEGISL